jgi:nicotinamide-nucleotide amidase
MIGEIIAIGDELTSGRIINSTSGLAARELFLRGHIIRAMHTIGDDPDLIGTTLNRAIERADFVLVTGGLGATTDDLTNEAVVKALNLETVTNPCVQARIEARVAKGTCTSTTSLAKLAQLPQGAEVLDEAYRMAGYLLRYQGKPIYFLPGVPPQMEILLQEKVLPGLEEMTPATTSAVAQRVYRTCGLSEIEINNQLHSLEQQGLEIGYYPVGAEVHVSLTGRDLAQGVHDPLFQQGDRFIREALGDNIYGTDEDTLASVVGELLVQHTSMLATAESCTGGLIGATLTQAAGSSDWFKGGVIVYSNALKENLLDVPAETLSTHGAVSAETARAMASGTVARLGSDIAISATGIAGPGGGTEEKPVGTVYIGLCMASQHREQRCHFVGSRRQIQEKTAQTAMDMVRRALLSR